MRGILEKLKSGATKDLHKREFGITVFFPWFETVKLCGLKDPIVSVLVEECAEAAGCYWAWWNNDDCLFHFVNSNRVGVEMCFPYGSKAEEDRGRGKLLPVNITELEESK